MSRVKYKEEESLLNKGTARPGEAEEEEEFEDDKSIIRVPVECRNRK